MKKIALAYSGGLDTTVIVPWLKENYDCEVVAICGDVGQACDWVGLQKKAIASGASKLIVNDLKKEFVEETLWSLVKAGSLYEGRYLLGTAAARPLIAKALAETAMAEGCSAIAHGCTGKGNDQVRFEMGIKAFAPDMEIIAPWRIWDMGSREEEVAYLEARGIPVPFKKGDSYSRDDNLWHVSHEGLDLEDPMNEPILEGMLKMCVPPEKAPDAPEYVELQFEGGVPVAIDGVKMDGVSLVARLNVLGGKHGVGILDMVENRVVGMKSRGVYETPAGAIIMEAHQKLEQLCLDRKAMSFKATVAQRFAELMYEGEWYSPLMEAVNAFVDSTQKSVSGTVKLKLWKGSLACAGMSSPYSLYDHSLASFATGPLFDHHDATGFINLYSLPVKARGLMKARLASESAKAAAAAATVVDPKQSHGSGGSGLVAAKVAAAY
ncbi:MAG: argininosuccinate synthase [Spirochaetae bacterium HGW-Spirochaetae-3]|jgi:argininosuccinate synthase|nr:MAG: argininosuccinate synthase [Spirochaetae bacterium HGW-Spirochaetae-3]